MKYKDAIVLHGNYASFKPGDKVTYPQVKSRLFLWNKSGQGEIIVNDSSYRLRPEQLLVIPWDHSIEYRADKNDPFVLGGIHVIPKHTATKNIVYRIAYSEESELANTRERQDITIEGFEDVVIIPLNEHLALSHLLDYGVQLFLMGLPLEWKVRQLGGLLLSEIESIRELEGSLHRTFPLELLELKQYILRHIDQPIEFKELIKHSHLSRSSIERLFKKHCNFSPVYWINQQKILKAKELLQTSTLSISDVGRRVGVQDPYYFSKLFKKYIGVSPRQLRKESSWL